MRKVIECFPNDVPLDSRVEQDVIGDRGVLLVSGGSLVNDKVLGLIKNYIGTVKVSIESELEDIEVDETEQAQTFHMDDSIKREALARIQTVYENPEDTGLVIEETGAIRDALIASLSSSDSTLISVEELKVSDEYTFKHSVDVAVLSMILAKRDGKSNRFIGQITQAGLLHDIGKSRIPKEILNKPSKLTEEEWKIMQMHPTYGYRMIQDSKDISEDIKLAILEHHENMDGTGYPVGAKGDRIHYMAKILTICDVYDALVTDRPYKEAKNPAEALEIMYAMSDKFDLKLFQEFLDCIILYPVRSTIRLSNGRLCAVIKNHQYYPLRPVVQDLVTGETYDLLNNPECRNLVIA